MKKNTESQRKWNRIHERNLTNRRCRKRKRLSARNRFPLSGTRVIKAPQIISLTDPEHRRELLEFLEQLRLSRYKKGYFRLDFSSTHRIFADGMVLFRAELCNIINNEHAATYRCILPHDTKIKEVLHQAGVLSLLNQHIPITPKHPDVVHWRTAHGIKADGVTSGTLLDEYEGQVAKELLSDLFVGVTEAMTNVHHHAYIPASEKCKTRKYCREDAENGRGWWMFSQKKGGFLHVVICDLGIGIPGSLPDRRPRIFEKLLSLGLGERDSRYIEYAVQDSVSRTEKNHRGKGLGQIVRGLFDHSADSEIAIFSNRGYYRERNGETYVHDFKESILGTVICWRTPLAT